MVKQLLLASLGLWFLAGPSYQASTISRFDCGTDTSHASEEFLNTIKGLQSGPTGGSHASRAVLSARETSNDTVITVDTVFHIVAKTESKGDVTDDMPQAQLDTLNEAYKDYGIQFNLVNVSWNSNDDWATGAKGSDLDMKKQLRQGTYRTLNIYFQTDLAGGVLGRCTLPANIANGRSDPTVYNNDGCNVNANTMPDGTMDGYNKGKTAVHETGHWLGLLHTFEGNSCDGPGDYIDDTPYERESTDGCPDSPPKSTCPDQPGSDKDDPIHNFMDYSTDDCYTGFTQRQHDRMHHMYNTFRDGN